MEEKRRSPRVIFRGLVHCKPTTQQELADIETMGRTLDISEVGILLETQYLFPLRTELKLGIALGDDIIEVKGKVVRLADVDNGNIRMGIEFTEISDKDKEIIRKHIGKEK